MSEPDNPQWLDQVSEELRADVPVRDVWRARVLGQIAGSPRPSANDPDLRFEDDTLADAVQEYGFEPSRTSARRRIVLRPLVGFAAALTFAAIGAGAMFAVMSPGNRGATRSTQVGATSSQPDGGAGAIPTADVAAHQSMVRFELSAPSATRVALVGSFNRWNPTATPLQRDPATGKWMVSVRLPAGRHVYAFVVDGDVTADPAAPRAADTDFGSANSVVLVSGRSS